MENPSDLDNRFDILTFCFGTRKLADKIVSKIQVPKDCV